MKIEQSGELNNKLVAAYMADLVNRFYKILPIKESGEDTLKQYLESLLREMMGFQHLIADFDTDDRYIALLSTLRYFIDYNPDVSVVKTDVFKAINILKKLHKKYCSKEA